MKTARTTRQSTKRAPEKSQPENVDDVLAGLRIGRCRKGDKGRSGEMVPEFTQRHVLRAEIVAPL